MFGCTVHDKIEFARDRIRAYRRGIPATDNLLVSYADMQVVHGWPAIQFCSHAACARSIATACSPYWTMVAFIACWLGESFIVGRCWAPFEQLWDTK